MNYWKFAWGTHTYKIPGVALGNNFARTQQIYYRTTGMPASVSASLAALVTSWKSVLKNASMAETRLDFFVLEWTSGSGPGVSTAFQSAGTITDWGSHITQMLPTQNTVTIQRRDGSMGQSGRGRFTVSPISVAYIDSAVENTTNKTETSLVALANKLKAPIVGVDQTFVPVITHAGSPLTFTDVTTTEISHRMTCMRQLRLDIPSWT